MSHQRDLFMVMAISDAMIDAAKKFLEANPDANTSHYTHNAMLMCAARGIAVRVEALGPQALDDALKTIRVNAERMISKGPSTTTEMRTS